jgi:hypothetical protein
MKSDCVDKADGEMREEVKNQHVIWLEQGEVVGDEQRTNLVYYLAVQPQRA